MTIHLVQKTDPPTQAERATEATTALERANAALAKLNAWTEAHRGADYCPRCGNKLSQLGKAYRKLICKAVLKPFSSEWTEGCGFTR